MYIVLYAHWIVSGSPYNCSVWWFWPYIAGRNWGYEKLAGLRQVNSWRTCTWHLYFLTHISCSCPTIQYHKEAPGCTCSWMFQFSFFIYIRTHLFSKVQVLLWYNSVFLYKTTSLCVAMLCMNTVQENWLTEIGQSMYIYIKKTDNVQS